MELLVEKVYYEAESGSLSKVVTSIDYKFTDSKSGVGAGTESVSGSFIAPASSYNAQFNHKAYLGSVKEANFVEWDSVTEEKCKQWISESFDSQTYDLVFWPDYQYSTGSWEEFTGSNETRISSSISDQIVAKNCKPW